LLRILQRAAVFAIVMIAASHGASATVLLAPEGQFFSASFPNQPSQEISEKAGVVHTIYSSPEKERFLMLSHALWSTDADPTIAMQSVLNGFTDQISDELLSIEKRNFISATGKKLAAKHFTFASSKVWGEGLIVMSGRHTYLIQVVVRKPSTGLDDVGKKFISSFKVLN
jgi:hypothetical protein